MIQKNTKLTNVLSRPANVSSLFGYYLGISREMKRKINIGFNIDCYVYKNGSMKEYRNELEMRKIRDVLFEYFKKYPKKTQLLLDDFNAEYRKMIALVDEVNAINLSNLPKLILERNIIKLIKKFEKSYLKVWPAVFLIYRIPPIAKKNHLTKRQMTRLAHLVKTRQNHDQEYTLACNFYDQINKLLQKYYQKINFTLFSPYEIIKFLENSRSFASKLRNITKRERGCIVLHQNVYNFCNGKELNKILLQNGLFLLENKQIAHKTIIKGQSAYKGIVRGVIRLVFSKADIVKINNGDIIVSPMTTQYFGNVFQKVKAIVTDEGGILSHAAIISRELGIPCIIGTKVATKVLKDGDLVEVDAERGVVKILKK